MTGKTSSEREDFERRQSVLERIAAALEHQAFVQMRQYDPRLCSAPVHKHNCAICAPQDAR
jgi:hypothetical protein